MKKLLGRKKPKKVEVLGEKKKPVEVESDLDDNITELKGMFKIQKTENEVERSLSPARILYDRMNLRSIKRK